MNKIILLFSLIFFLQACENSNRIDDPLNCNVTCNDCISVLNNTSGKTLMLSCFGKQGIEFDLNDSLKGYVIPYEWDEKFLVENLSVKFCGTLYKNEIRMLFPDPSINGPIYRIKLEEIELR